MPKDVLRHPWRFEPAAIGAFLNSITGLIAAFYGHFTDVQMAAINSLVACTLALFVRQAVTPAVKL